MKHLGGRQLTKESSSARRTCLFTAMICGGALILGMIINVDLVIRSALWHPKEPRITTTTTTIEATTTATDQQVNIENPPLHYHHVGPSTVGSSQNEKLPPWVTGWPEDFAHEMIQGSTGLTDKVDDYHQFQMAYQPILSRLVRRKLLHSPNPTIRFLEIGLGCAPEGGMVRQTPGGSALAWRHLFRQVRQVSNLELDLHIMEYDAECGQKWAQNHTTTAVVHIGDASSTSDLMRVIHQSGGQPFDVIIDDGSHINWHQITTLDFLLPFLADGGTYFVEDIGSACGNWNANMGHHYGPSVGGTRGCLTTNNRQATILAHLMEYQRALVGARFGHELSGKNVTGIAHVDIYSFIAAITKDLSKKQQ